MGCTWLTKRLSAVISVLRQGPSTKAAFTIIELLIVVAILGILVALGLPSYQRYMLTQHTQNAKLDLGVISSAAQDNFATYGSYTVPDVGLLQLVGQSSISSRILLNEVTLATGGNTPPYVFAFRPSSTGFVVIATPDGNNCSGCPTLELSSNSNQIVFR